MNQIVETYVSEHLILMPTNKVLKSDLVANYMAFNKGKLAGRNILYAYLRKLDGVSITTKHIIGIQLISQAMQEFDFLVSKLAKFPQFELEERVRAILSREPIIEEPIEEVIEESVEEYDSDDDDDESFLDEIIGVCQKHATSMPTYDPEIRMNYSSEDCKRDIVSEDIHEEPQEEHNEQLQPEDTINEDEEEYDIDLDQMIYQWRVAGSHSAFESNSVVYVPIVDLVSIVHKRTYVPTEVLNATANASCVVVNGVKCCLVTV
jgi:hypothetical protein